MANSKAYLSFGLLLFVFLISSQVLAHDEERETNPFKDKNNPSLQDQEIDWSRGSTLTSRRHRMEPGYKNPRLEDTEESNETENGEMSDPGFQMGDPIFDWTFPQVSRKVMPRTRYGYYTQSVGYNPSQLQDIEPENHGYGYVIRRGSMKPSEIGWRTFPVVKTIVDSRTFPVFMAKTTPRMRTGGKIGYGNPRMEDVGEETKEDETYPN